MLKRIIGIMMLAVGVISHSQALAANEPNRLALQQEITIETGTTEVVVPVQLENENTITGFQCDLYLPTGFSVATDTYGDYLIEMSRTTTRRHNLDTRILDNGCQRILCSSMTNATFTGNSGTVLSLTLSVAANVEAGSYPVSLKNIVLTDPQAVRYTSGDVTGNIVVKLPDPITIKANNLTMTYGDEVPELTFTTEGAELVGTPLLSCEATKTSPVGTYPIVVSKGTVENKRVTYVNGTLTITKAPLTIAAGTYTKKQGEAMPEFTLSYEGFKNNETKDALTKLPTVSCEATVASAPGEYPVTISGAEAQNYDISYTNGKLVVTAADPVRITANSYTREYGEINPTFEFTTEGAILEGVPEISCEATATSPVGTYDIIVKQGTVTNYNVTYAKGTLTITKAPLTASVGNYSREYKQKDPEFVINYSGWKNDDDESVLIAKPVATTTATKESPIGEYPIIVSGGEAQNYEFNYVNGVLTVTKTTNIGDAPITNKKKDSKTIYDLQGRKVTNMKKGLYIVGGRKVVK